MGLHRNSAAAAARHSELQTDAILRDHATTRQEIVRNAAMQQRVAESLRGMPTQLAEAVLTAMRGGGAAANTPDAAAPASPASFASPSPAANPAVDPAAAAASPTASPSPAADPASPAATVPGPSRITSQNPFSEQPPVGHHEPGAHKPATNPGAKEAIKQALEAEGMIKKSVDLAAKREKAQQEAIQRVAQEQLAAESGPATQTRIDEQAKGVANQATLLRAGGDYVTPAAGASSSAAADTGGGSSHESRGRKQQRDSDTDKSRREERDRSARGGGNETTLNISGLRVKNGRRTCYYTSIRRACTRTGLWPCRQNCRRCTFKQAR